MESSSASVWEGLRPLFYDPTYLFAFGVLAALLLAAQALNFLRVRSATATDTDRKVQVIIASWWRIVVIVFAAFWGGLYTAVPVFYLLSLYAVKEYVGVSSLRDNTAPLLAGSALGITLHYSSLLLGSQFLFFASLTLFTIVILLPFLVLTKRPERLPALIAFYLGTMILAIFLSFPLAVLRFQEGLFGSPAAARLAVLLLIVLTEANDIFQFLCGKLFGRRKVIPSVSPNKTEAGFLGGALLSTLVAALLWPRFAPLTMGESAALGLLLSLSGMLGDLVCSAVKRHRGVKDFSDLLPGHGGMIDRVDSLIVTAPIFFFFLHFVRGGGP